MAQVIINLMAMALFYPGQVDQFGDEFVLDNPVCRAKTAISSG